MEGDNFAESISLIKVISIHSLRMEGDPDIHTALFQFFYFNPLPPHGGRRKLDAARKRFITISIHSLRMEGDADSILLNLEEKLFQSTPSAWRETW